MSASSVATAVRDPSGVTFARTIRSEWVKLVTVRSTFWTTTVALLLAALTITLIAANVHPERGSRADAGLLLNVSTVSLGLVALVVGVLGVLSIGGEYATLQIRSSYAAVPRRWPALLAKAAVVSAWSFVIGLVVGFGSLGVAALFFGADGARVVLDGPLVGGLVGGALYLAVVGAFAVGLGALVRSSAAGITILAALLFVLPGIVSLFGALTRLQWVMDLGHVLLSEAGGVLSAAPGTASLALWGAALALAAWLAVVWVPALLLTRARDV